MDRSTVVTMSSIAALAIYAVLDESAVMLVSVVAIGLIVRMFHRARMRDRIIAVVAASLGGSLGAEIVRTLYHHLVAAGSGPGGESNGLFMSALLIGLINAAVIIMVLITSKAWLEP